MVAGRDAEHPQPVEDDAEHDGFPGHACPDRGETRHVDEEKRDRLRIDDIVVAMMISCGALEGVGELIPNSCWHRWKLGLANGPNLRTICLAAKHHKKKRSLVRLSGPCGDGSNAGSHPPVSAQSRSKSV